MNRRVNVQQPSVGPQPVGPQPVNPGYAQYPVAQAQPKKSKAPIVIGAVAAVLVAALIGAGFATNWFGFAGHLISSGSSDGSSASSAGARTDSGESDSSSPNGESDVWDVSEAAAMPDSAAVTKKLVVGFDPGFPPYGYIDKGQYKGLDLDLAREVCKRNGWDFNAVPVEWDEKDSLLESGEINCIWSAFAIEGREGAFTFSEPYMKVESNYEDEGITTENYAVGFKLGDTETAEIVSDTLQEMYKDGTVEKIMAEYASHFGDLDQAMDCWVLK